MIIALLLCSMGGCELCAQTTADSTESAAADSTTQDTVPAQKSPQADPYDGRGRPQNLHMSPVRIEGKSFLVDYELPFEGYVYIYLFNSKQERVGLATWVKKVGYHTARLSRKYLKLGETYTLTLNYKGQMLQAQFQTARPHHPSPKPRKKTMAIGKLNMTPTTGIGTLPTKTTVGITRTMPMKMISTTMSLRTKTSSKSRSATTIGPMTWSGKARRVVNSSKTSSNCSGSVHKRALFLRY